MCVQTHRLCPDAPGAQDAPDAPWQRTYRSQRKTHRQCEFGRSSPQHHAPGRSSPRHLFTGRRVAGHFRSGCTVSGHFPSGRTVSGHFPSGRSRVRAFSFWTPPCQGIFLLDAAVSGHFPSGRSRVRAFSFWTQPCQGIFLLDAAVSGQMASGRRVSWHRGYAGCQITEHRSKYSHRIHKHAAASRHSDSVQFYSSYLMYIYICYYHTSRFQHKHPASHPLPLFLTHVALL